MQRFYSLFAFLLISSLVSAQPKPVIKNLVFEGAGIRGIAYCGAIQELEKQGILSQVEKVCGTSAGAIVALTLSLGYTADEIKTIVGKTNFKKFNDGNYFMAGGINRINKYFGWYRGKRVENWLEDMIAAKTGNADITFEELRRRGFKELHITGTCLNKQRLIFFSHENYPNMKVKDAVRISMSIPLYFEAVFIDKSGTVISHPKKMEGLDIFIDGGLTGNFPIKAFDHDGKANMYTLGFRIDSDDQITNDKGQRELAAMPVTKLNQYLAAFYNMIVENLNRQPLTAEDWQRTVSISDGKVAPRIRKLSTGEISTLMNNGSLATQQFLQHP